MRGFPSHVDLTATDLERSIPFYDRVLGRLGYRRPPAGRPPPTWFRFRRDRSFFSLALQPTKPPSAGKEHDRYAPGLHHLAFHVESRQEVDDFFQFLVETQAPVLDPPAEYDYTPGYYAVFFADPDGLKLEVVHEPAQDAATGCCPFCGGRLPRDADACGRCGLVVRA
jgi:catechol 2,3-dioxygenase-like lactoylglutathione lyase family enzyme